MAETATFATTNAPQNREDFKLFFLQLLEEDASFYYRIKSKLLVKEEKSKKKVRKPLPPPIPFSEMPSRKLRPNFVPLDPKPYAIKKEALIKVQEAWRDMPSAEELVALLKE